MDATEENMIPRLAAPYNNIHTVPKPFPITELLLFHGCYSGSDRLRGASVRIVHFPDVLNEIEVESLMEARARVLQMQAEKNRFIRMHTMRKSPGLDRFAGTGSCPLVPV
ncbi:hypothetical protein K7X08_026000 [Anisodus acutangulus]|uniref:Uncharacterized protein n=1 Tax=Anisodus acutangulus TaxID=402998 RepID=A0A9Q1N5Q8_9SOLA|nr:hypothetical protein K7X08_026000 [Anisodus acutangulus]